MNIATITPFDHLNLSNTFSHTYLALGQHKKPGYRSFFTSAKEHHPDSFVIADNGANETTPLMGMDLVNFAREVNADEVILPDAYHDADATNDMALQFIKYYGRHTPPNMNFMAVPQGKTSKEYLESFYTFCCNNAISTIGIGYRNLLPAFESEIETYSDYDWVDKIGIDGETIRFLKYILDDKCFKYTVSRLYFFKTYAEPFFYLKYLKKKVHMLGIWNPFELKLLKDSFRKGSVNYRQPGEPFKWLRSCDSATLSQASQAGVLFHPDYGVTDKPKPFLDFDEPLTTEGLDLFKRNVQIMKYWL